MDDAAELMHRESFSVGKKMLVRDKGERNKRTARSASGRKEHEII